MLERWCSWHLPEPIIIESIDDGKELVTKTHGFCQECFDKQIAELAEGGVDGVPLIKI